MLGGHGGLLRASEQVRSGGGAAVGGGDAVGACGRRARRRGRRGRPTRRVRRRRAWSRMSASRAHEEVGGQVGEGDAGGEVDGVDHHLAGAQPRDLGGGDLAALGRADRALPVAGGEPPQVAVEGGGLLDRPGAQGRGWTGRALRDALGTFVGGGVHRRLRAGGRPPRQVAQRGRVGGQVGDQVRTAPPGEARRLGEPRVGQPGHGDVAQAGALLDPAQAVGERALRGRDGHDGSATTTFSRRPMPSISVTTRWPAER